jgi:alcohol dehydrogenase class IV
MADVRWRDGEAGRSVFLREGLLAEAPALLAGEGWDPYELLTTERARGEAPALVDGADRVHLVPQGQVPEVAAAVIDDVGSDRLVAFGGGRVIDAAKAIAAVRGGALAAIPTTLSGAEMTAIHRLPAGHDGIPGVRPALVIADPASMTSLPEPQLRATALNALAHGADCLYTPLADELSRSAALAGAHRIGRELDAGPDRRSRSELAFGAILCGQAIDAAGLAIHHVISQSAVRVCGTPHAETNAAVLPVAMDEMRSRAPEQIERLAAALDCEPEEIRARIEALGGGRRGLSELGASDDCREPLIETALARPELEAMTPGEVTRADVERILAEAW